MAPSLQLSPPSLRRLPKAALVVAAAAAVSAAAGPRAAAVTTSAFSRRAAAFRRQHRRWSTANGGGSADGDESDRLRPSQSRALQDDDTQQRHWKRYRLRGSTSEHSASGVRVLTDTGHVLETDLPLRMGGADVAPQPVEHLLAAWAGCTQATALFVARHLRPSRVPLRRLEFDVYAVRDAQGALNLPLDDAPPVPSRLLALTGVIRVFSTEALSAETLEALREQTELRCPVANMMIASGCDMNVTWVDGSSSSGEEVLLER